MNDTLAYEGGLELALQELETIDAPLDSTGVLVGITIGVIISIVAT
jgi:hypothetical protein